MFQKLLIKKIWERVWVQGFMVFNATFNNISVILWRSVLLVKETRGPGENHRLYHIMLYTSPWTAVEPKTSVVINTDCRGNCKSNYHMITATTTPSMVNYFDKYTTGLFYIIKMWNWGKILRIPVGFNSLDNKMPRYFNKSIHVQVPK